jgi:hypothetical protein
MTLSVPLRPYHNSMDVPREQRHMMLRLTSHLKSGVGLPSHRTLYHDAQLRLNGIWMRDREHLYHDAIAQLFGP